MKIISIAGVMASGKTTTVNALLNRLPNSTALYFDNYDIEGEITDFERWVSDGADWNFYDVSPLEKDIVRIMKTEKCDYLILDYPLAYRNDKLSKYIDMAFFIDTPLDIALARQVLRDMQEHNGQQIREYMESYLNGARVHFVQYQKDIRDSSDVVINGTMSLNKIVEIICRKIMEQNNKWGVGNVK